MMSTTGSNSLLEAARTAVARYPDSDNEVALAFCETALPAFLGASNDRLVKCGRSLRNLVDDMMKEDDALLEQALQVLVAECNILLLDGTQNKVPTVRFGKTGIQMPIVTLGCMRFQQEWGPRITNMNMVGADCQDNLVAILKMAISHGMMHIETARGYGCSEIQLGCALKQLFLTGYVKREDLIIQSKVPANASAAEFRAALELSLTNLQTDYLDLFALHGMNFEEQLEWVFGKEGDDETETCMAVLQEFKAAGKIRHLGFSTHGSTALILKCIETDAFDYVNLHYHYFGSYTASGGGHDGQGNLNCVKLMGEKDMGIFIISPFDKGGRLYEPSRKLRSLTLPEMEPMTFKSHWLWQNHLLYEGLPQIHTYTLGAARPSDLDQALVAAYLHATKPDETLAKLKTVTARLDQAREDALGKEWVANWWKGLPKAAESKYHVEHNQIVWIYNSIKAFGMYEFGKARYGSFEGNGSKWDDSLTPEQNIADKIGKNAWGFVPGLPLKPGVDYSEDLVNVPPENLERVKEAQAFVLKWCAKEESKDGTKKEQPFVKVFRRTFSVSSQTFRMPDLRGVLDKAKSSEDKVEKDIKEEAEAGANEVDAVKKEEEASEAMPEEVKAQSSRSSFRMPNIRGALQRTLGGAKPEETADGGEADKLAEKEDAPKVEAKIAGMPRFRLPRFGGIPLEGEEPKGEEAVDQVPEEWRSAYDMRTWPDYPDQPSRG